MKRHSVKKVLLYTTAIIAVLVVVLAVHIYMVTRPAKVDKNTVALARIDINGELSATQINELGQWLNTQPGVERNSYNPHSHILIFSFRPALLNADMVSNQISSRYNIKATRYVPSAADMQSGCPVATTSVTYKTYNFFKNIL